MIVPRTLKGFRDFLPETMLPRERIIAAAASVYQSYGFAPIDTPALEYLDILQGKGSDETDKQLYKFTDHGGREVGMRFDLTVPLARYTAQHFAELVFPFKRYHFGKVWRGENTQAGRYREFMQCDFDTIGTKSIAADIEAVLVINDLFNKIGVAFTVKINNRKILNGLLDKHGIADKTVPVLRALDKIHKIGKDGVFKELSDEIHPHQAGAVLELAGLKGTNDEILAALNTMLKDNATGEEGIDQLAKILATVNNSKTLIDVSIARGLNYYTGTIYETFLDELPSIGSVCSGGRYDNLAELYTKQELPGIGGSLGLDRLLSALEELGQIEKVSTPVQVFIPYFVESRLPDYLRLCSQLRHKGIGVEFYPEAKKLGNQLKYADKRGFKFAVIIGEDEFNAGLCKVKNLATGESADCPLTEIESFTFR